MWLEIGQHRLNNRDAAKTSFKRPSTSDASLFFIASESCRLLATCIYRLLQTGLCTPEQ